MRFNKHGKEQRKTATSQKKRMLEEVAASVAGGSSHMNDYELNFQHTLTCNKCNFEKQVHGESLRVNRSGE